LIRSFSEYLEIDFSVFENKDIIEIGCGPRAAINFIKSPGKRIGIDSLLDEFKKRGILFELDHVHLLQQKAENLEFPSEEFDIALCLNVLDHVENIDQALTQIFRVLKYGGLFLMNIHTFEVYSTLFPTILQRFDPTHPFHFSKKQVLHHILNAGFSIELVSHQPLGLTSGNLLFRTAANFIGRTLWIKAHKRSKYQSIQ